jgi:hypothetical protein
VEILQTLDGIGCAEDLAACAFSRLFGEAERAGLTGIFWEFRAALEEETGTGWRTTTAAVRDGGRNAR